MISRTTAGRLADRLPEPVANGAREVKHRAAVFLKHAGWGFPTVRGPLLEPLHRARHDRRPPVFATQQYATTWLGPSLPARPIAAGEPIPRRIFTVWTGTNDMPARRQANLDTIRDLNPGIEVVLVTPGTIADWLVPGEPLPAAYEHLSLVHRSDVLRAYLLHHHGGGYADIKRCLHPWHTAFDRLESSTAWMLGYRERHRLLVPLVGGRLEQDLRRASPQLVGYGGLITRRHTPLTGEWWQRACDVVDTNAEELARHPGNIRGDNPGYPLSWTEVLAHIVAPLTWKYHEHVLHDDTVLPRLRSYT